MTRTRAGSLVATLVIAAARTPVPSGNSGAGFYATDLTIDYTTN